MKALRSVALVAVLIQSLSVVDASAREITIAEGVAMAEAYASEITRLR